MKNKKLLTLSMALTLACIVMTGCRDVSMDDVPRTTIALKDAAFDMIHLPAMKFPGGKLGTVLLTETRAKVIGVESDFWLAETNTSYALWKTVYDWALTRGYEFTRPGQMGSEKGGEGMTDQHPVTVVDWPSAAVWCNALTEFYNELNGGALKQVYVAGDEALRKSIPRLDADTIVARPDADGFRLPTGLEWELAARFSKTDGGEGYVEYPRWSGRYWSSFLQVSGEVESKEGPLGSEGRNVVSRPVLELERNDLGFTGFAGPDGKLWQWCYEFLYHDGRDAFHMKRGGSRSTRCGRHDNWPKTKWDDTCTGYDQITFRVARNG